MHRNKSVDVHQFAMVPRAEIPRSSFRIQKGYKSAFDAGWLIPFFIEEVLPGDTFNVKVTAFARLATPLFPVMDNMYLETFFFYVPNRLVWANWVKMMGEQNNPADSISYVVPQSTSPAGGYIIGSVHDYMGLPTVGQVAGGNTVSHSALPLRAYSLIYNQWFRDENLQNSFAVSTGDGPDVYSTFGLFRRGKRHDYFTSCLPFVQKGASVLLPLGTSAPVKGFGIGNAGLAAAPLNTHIGVKESGGTPRNYPWGISMSASTTANWIFETTTGVAATAVPTVYADLTQATAATINQIRQAFQIQKLLERDARGGTRYTEIVRSHFGVVSPDARLQRPEYLGGGSTPVTINPIAQTSNTPAVGTPLGNLSAFGTALAHGHGFSQSFVEHGHIIGIVNIRADLTYQQGIRKFWNRSTRYDFYWPVFAMLGEQAVLNKEIYCDGSANDTLVFGYQERWAEYRYNPSQITGLMRSTAAGTIDPWHLAQRFVGLPTLNDTFIKDTPPVDRILAVGAGANGQQFLFDAFCDMKVARPMPLYSVPGMVDHF